MPSIYDTGAIIIPLNVFTPNWKIEVGTDNITDYLMRCGVDLPVTQRVRSANITIANPDGKWTNELPEGGIIKIYADYASATNQIFEGRLETPTHRLSSSTGHTIELFARGYGADALKRKVTYAPDSADTITNIFKYLRDTYLPYHSSDNSFIASIATTYKPSWSGRPLWNCFQDLMIETGNTYYFYCDISKKWHLVERNSTICTQHTMTYGDNVKEFYATKDLTNLVNRFWVYGKDLKGIPILKMKEDTAIQTQYGFISEEIIKDTNLASLDQVTTKATNLLSKSITLEQFGGGTCLGLPNLNTGEKILINVPYCNVSGWREVISLRHTIDAGGFLSIVTFAEEEKGTIEYMKDRILKEQEITDIENKYNLEEKDKTIVWDKALLLDLGETEGYAITNPHTADNNITQIELKVTATNVKSDAGEDWISYQISVDDGISWEFIEPDTLHEVDGTGKILKIRIDITSLTTKVTSIGVLYK